MQPTVFLFDIDGTLLTSGGAGRRAVQLALADVTGHADACRDVPMAGMTDRAIVRACLQRTGIEASPDRIDAVLARYLDLLPAEVARVAAGNYRLHPGVLEALDRLHRRGACAIGLGTGNVERGARIKLGRLGIDNRFAFGGFGCDHEDRAALVAVGAERGAKLLGLAVAECRVVVIGDTPRDVAAAKAMGAACLAVATGPFDVATLVASGATLAVADLLAPAAVDWLS